MATKKSSRFKKDNLIAQVVEGDNFACSFCHHSVNDEILYGKLYSIGDIYCHYFCVLLSCCLVQKGEDEEGLLGFLYSDIKAEIERSKKHKCSYCGKEGATLGCIVQQCRKQFHVPCGQKRNAVSLFYGNYKTFCEKHAPRQKVPEHIMDKAKLRLQVAKKRGKISKTFQAEISTTSPSKLFDDESPNKECVCVLCYELVEGYPSPRTFWPSCCGTDQWFHRHCLQRMALTAGMHYLKCPLCNDKELFYQAIMEQGYYVPDRDAAWELEQNAFSDMYGRQMECSAPKCECDDGVERDDDTGDWCITPCLLCGSVGIHNACHKEPSRFICDTCTPAAPEDLGQLEKEITAVIAEEQRRKAVAAAVTLRPVMPSRMSIRRTKGLINSKSKPSTSRYVITSTNEDRSVNYSPQTLTNTKLSRLELNLSSPKKRTYPFSNITNQSQNKSPMKIIEQSVYDRINSLDLKVESTVWLERIKNSLSKPRPLCAKKRIVSKIVDEALKEANKQNLKSSPKYRSPLKMSHSPKKLGHLKEFQESAAPFIQENIEVNHLGVENITPTKEEEIPKNSPENCEELNNDESSSSTFHLPPEFIADRLSDDSANEFETPEKLKKVDLLNENIEISNINDDIVNIDLFKNNNSPSNSKFKCVDSNLECSKTVTEDDKLTKAFDPESFKARYLNEMFKCEFNHKHKNVSKSPKLKTAISYAVKAASTKLSNVDCNMELADYELVKKMKRKMKNKKRKAVRKSKMAAMKNKSNLKLNNREATDQIEITYDKPKAKRAKKKKDNTKLSIKNKNLKLKIRIKEASLKLKITKRKKKKECSKNKTSSPNKLTQTILNFTPDNNTSQIVRPQNNRTPTKKAIKREKSQDKLVQTTLHSFFKTGP